ncbi:hypothetical protein C8J57DRAFT_1304557 [Mycena rebaudengoi]|nr:hypothetical protein C8J57DRAFT_1304557 [Mycena rebaudengoi]
MSLEASVFAARYVSAIGVATIYYDHLLTLGDELRLIWFNSAAGIGNRLGFIINRYISEATTIFVAYMLSGSSTGLTTETCKIFIYIFGTSSTIFVAISHFIIVGRLYTLWDRRKRIKWILAVALGTSMSISMAFSILAAHQAQSFLKYNPFIRMCTFSHKPWALQYSLASLTVLDLFIIVMTVFNALDKPYQRQADVMISLQNDGARIFVCLFLLRLISLIMSIVGDPDNCFVTLIMVWTMSSVATSRLQLRVEALRFIRFTSPADHDIDTEYELYDVYG